jgi:anaerobic selenocysteine-containing dehydrogenase
VKKGATLIVIDPKRTRIAEQAHHYVQIAPGTDVVLALALSAEIERRNAKDSDFIEQWVLGSNLFLEQAQQYTLQDAAGICGISVDEITRLADLYVGAKTLATSIGNGIERGKSGGSGLRAIMSLNVLLGQFGRCGAGVVAKPGLAFPYTPEKLQRPDLIPEGTRTLNIVDVGRHLLMDDIDPPLRAVFIYNHNPIATHPDQNRMIRALSRPELFNVGIDIVMTDSMRYCDIVLPASSHFEFDDIYGAYGHSYLQRAEPVIPPVGNSLPNTEIFRRLASSFGMDDPMFAENDLALLESAIDASDKRLPGHRISDLPTDQAILMKANASQEVLMCNTVSPKTRSGKIELFDQDLEEKFGFGVPRYEPAKRDRRFTIISPSSSKRTNATFGSHQASDGVEVVEIHPADAREVGAKEGSLLRVTNSRGEVTLKVRLTDAVRQGVLYTPKGSWIKTSNTGQTVNALISADIKTDIMDGACYNETFVDVEVSP